MNPVTDRDFEVQVLKNEKPVLVDFHAEWCGPCRRQTPILEQLQAEIGGRIEICALDIDKEPGAMDRYRVRAVPTLILFKKGEVVKRWTGLTSLDALKKAIEE